MSAERAFLAAAAAHAAEWQEALDEHAELLAVAAQDSLDAVEGAMAELYDAVAFAGWTSPNGDRLPERLPATGTPRLLVKGEHVDLDTLLGAVRREAASLRPEARREAKDRAAEQAAVEARRPTHDHGRWPVTVTAG